MSVNWVRRCTFVLLATGALACGDRPTPYAPLVYEQALGRTTVQKSKIVERSARLKNNVVARATITPAGGTLVIEQAGLTVVFPPGAVTRSIAVTAIAHAGKEVVYSFEPHGTQFNAPVSIEQLVSATKYSAKKDETQPNAFGGYLLDALRDVDGFGVGTFSETFDAEYDSRAGATYIRFHTKHFSGFALATGIRRIQL